MDTTSRANSAWPKITLSLMGMEMKSPDSFSDCWFYRFMGRLPDLKIFKPQKLAISRAKSASREASRNPGQY